MGWVLLSRCQREVKRKTEGKVTHSLVTTLSNIQTTEGFHTGNVITIIPPLEHLLIVCVYHTDYVGWLYSTVLH